MQVFTDENFTGYEFRCTASNASVGYRHECEVYKGNTLLPKYAEEFINKYNGFIQVYEVAQFVQPFQLWIPNENLGQAKAELESKF